MRELRVLVTGSRIWNDAPAIELAFSGLQAPPEAPVTIVHGGAQGLDLLASQIAAQRGWYTEAWPVYDEDWIEHGKFAGPRRNRMMVDSGVDVCYGFPVNLTSWSGTLGCMTMADMADIPVFTGPVMDRWHASDWMKERITY